MKKQIYLNILFSIILQFVAVANSFIVSKVTIIYFGSEINGLVSSINQFLNYISLLEGGVGAVVMANLYKPLYDNDQEEVSKILNSSRIFFNKIIIIFTIYTLMLSLIYPLITKTPISREETSLLIWILSVSLCAQYFFAISYKILLQTDHKLYICSAVQILAYLINIILVLIASQEFKSILFVRLFSSFAFLLQPISYSICVKKLYSLRNFKKFNGERLHGQWDGFFQNLSFFINNNTDIVLITFFLGLKEVSVYAVYMLVINGVKSLVLSISTSFQSTLGRKLVAQNKKDLNSFFTRYSYIVLFISLIGYCLVILLIRPFVYVYVGHTDSSYDRVIFPILIAISQMIICLREPFNMIINSANKFRETNMGAILEALINIFLSIILIKKYGLAGVALGTLIASIFRGVYFIRYLHKDIMFIRYYKLLKPCILIIFSILFTLLFYFNYIKIENYTWMKLITVGLLLGISMIISIVVESIVLWPKKIGRLLRDFLKR